MAGPAVDALLHLLDEALEGRGIEESNESQALLTNLATVTDAEWRALPLGATRTIESMVLHVTACKVMYDDYAFGPGTKQGAPPRSMVGWAPKHPWPRRSSAYAGRIGPSSSTYRP